MSTYLNLELVTELVDQKLQNKPVDKLVGEPTIVTYGIPGDQVAVTTSAVKKPQWGGKHGHLSLIVNEAKYRLITTIATRAVERQVKPAGTDTNIDGKKNNFEHIKFSRAQGEKNQGVTTPGGDGRAAKRKIIEAVDEEYLGELKKTTWGTVTKRQNPSSLT